MYIHYPFCKRVCFYCHFTKQNYDHQLSGNYISFLLKELELKGNKNKKIDTIYFGGGSPGLIDKKEITEIFKSISNHYSLSDNFETTIELNPEDADLDKLKFFKKIGFNRISIGTQSFEPEDLKYLKRSHSDKLSFSVINDIKKAGFENISADFIIGLPSQSKDTLLHGFNIVKELDIPHISVYILEGVKDESEKENLNDEYLYFQSEVILNKLGFSRYEVSNYSFPNFESIHNKKYWENKEYIGIGLSASGFEKNIDYKNTEDLEEYFNFLKNEKLPIVGRRKTDTNERTIITGLRTAKGVKKKFFSKYEDKLELLLKEKILRKSGDYISIEPNKILLLNEILTYFR